MMLVTRENQETEPRNPNWWHELCIILLGKLQGKVLLQASYIDLVIHKVMFWHPVTGGSVCVHVRVCACVNVRIDHLH
jgi:hypothetical protein